ncbi:MAG: TRZ/ATZ family hydrolase, partial [Gammaproteobacteria bacterium]|nr:TRZ/ATZ family hydrolase [Gammaproteobacteria bacterium]
TPLNTQPVYDPVTQIVYAANSRQVSHVWIAGDCQLADFQLCSLDEEKIRHKAQAWRNKIKTSDQESS